MNQETNEEIVFSGKIGEVVHTTQPDGRVFERYRRAPGTRLVIITPDKKLIMTREHRQEIGNIDLRLPGGKVRDTLGEYHELLESGKDIVAAASEAAAKEASEEVGVTVTNLKLLTKATAGATVEWDLYYFMTSDYQENAGGQNLEQGERIERVELSAAEIRQAIKRGEMQEWRSVGVLLGLVLPQLETA
ncbi:MAG TPA: NUDIX domain-containing protein [Candidatus Saccharimonadales bacterium]|nr:NUDIX domain-containing protein [Candidatus Saccharimonadales bacterium]